MTQAAEQKPIDRKPLRSKNPIRRALPRTVRTVSSCGCYFSKRAVGNRGKKRG